MDARSAKVLLKQFFRFGAVGAIGFVFDTTTVYVLRGALGLHGAGWAAYLVAATVNWRLNRAWTFGGSPLAPAFRQWLRFLAANVPGFILNRGTYSALLLTAPVTERYPVLAVAAGVGAGMFLNFFLSRRVFQRAGGEVRDAALSPVRAVP